MRIADAITALDKRPSQIHAANPAAEDVAAAVAQQLGIPAVPANSTAQPDQPSLTLVVVEDDDVRSGWDAAWEHARLAGPGTDVLLLLGVDCDPLRTDLLGTVGQHELELAAVLDVSHPTLSTAMHFIHAEDSDAATLRSEVVLLRAIARQVEDTTTANTVELARRKERIAALSGEVHALRERIASLESQQSRELKVRDRRIKALERRAADIEQSTSYRLGRAIVRVSRNPRLLLKLPGKLWRRVRT